MSQTNTAPPTTNPMLSPTTGSPTVSPRQFPTKSPVPPTEPPTDAVRILQNDVFLLCSKYLLYADQLHGVLFLYSRANHLAADQQAHPLTLSRSTFAQRMHLYRLRSVPLAVHFLTTHVKFRESVAKMGKKCVRLNLIALSQVAQQLQLLLQPLLLHPLLLLPAVSALISCAALALVAAGARPVAKCPAEFACKGWFRCWCIMSPSGN